MPSTEALKLALLLAAYPGGEHAAILRCKEQLEQMVLAYALRQRRPSRPTQQEIVTDHGHQEDAEGEGEEDPQQQSTTFAEGYSHLYGQYSQHQEPIISMIKSWALHGGAAGATSAVVHVLATSNESTLYVQPGGGLMPDAQAFFQEAAAATGEGRVAGPPSCLTARGIFAGAVEQKNFCSTPMELVESIANRMESEIVPALYQRPLKGRTVLITVDEQDKNSAQGESFLAVELVAAAEARRQKEPITV